MGKALGVTHTTVRGYIIGRIRNLQQHMFRYAEGLEIASKPLKGL